MPVASEEKVDARDGFRGKVPPGFVAIPSGSRPGEFSYYCNANQTKYATLQLAWNVYEQLSGGKKLPTNGTVKRQPSLEHTCASREASLEHMIQVGPKRGLPVARGCESDPEINLMDTTPFVDPDFPPTLQSIGKVAEEDKSSRLRISIAERDSIKFVRLPIFV